MVGGRQWVRRFNKEGNGRVYPGTHEGVQRSRWVGAGWEDAFESTQKRLRWVGGGSKRKGGIVNHTGGLNLGLTEPYSGRDGLEGGGKCYAPKAVSYKSGPVMSQPLEVYLIWHGTWPVSQKTPVQKGLRDSRDRRGAMLEDARAQVCRLHFPRHTRQQAPSFPPSFPPSRASPTPTPPLPLPRPLPVLPVPSYAPKTVSYKSGPVMSQPLEVYLIWHGTWPASQKTPVQKFVDSISDDTLANKPGSVKDWWNINRLYKAGATYVTPTVSRSNTEIDIAAASSASGQTPLKKADLLALINFQILSGSLPRISSAVYVIFTSADVDVDGFGSDFCAFHSVSGNVKWAWVGMPEKVSARCFGEGECLV
ncbi:unnamed protein product [Closterium sp. Naga37s-1]|nr:unnamed protein product [Closterium sp. Naga37s-1]